jgi:hypothetical protein
MRKTIALILAAAMILPAAPSRADTEWRFADDYRTRSRCHEIGQAHLDAGTAHEYQCVLDYRPDGTPVLALYLR